MQGLPIAGQEDAIGSPYEYGQFQSFLPDVGDGSSPNPMATGLTRDMLEFRSPTGVTAPDSNALRGALAAIRAQQGPQGPGKDAGPLEWNVPGPPQGYGAGG
jgi:hypothetical protein